MLSTLRIGQGYDVHAFADGRKLILGNVTIPSSRGLTGHSDADVLLHAVIDSLLGAVADYDIGTHFPDTDDAYKAIDSAELFGTIWASLRAKGWRLINCDSTVVAESPRLAEHIPAIRQRLAELFSAEVSQVSVKATTSEKMGFIGRGEGIAAIAVSLLTRE